MPDETAELIGEWLNDSLVNIVGGCCGTTPEHIAAIAKAVEDKEPRKSADPEVQTRLSGLEPFTMAA